MKVTILVGERLHKIRKEKNLTLRELGNSVGVSASHIGQIEKGVTNPSIELLARLAEFLKIHPCDLLLTTNISMGERIRSIREEKGIDLEVLSKTTGIEYFKLGEVEIGNERLSKEECEKISTYLEIDNDELNFDIEVNLNHIRFICHDVFQLDEDSSQLIMDYLTKKINW
ncbi:MAG: helix-turn-helix transcriptional regulator [Halanaerobiales bacterium]|nr:helix-turn-helix transcriptional regulator [Halanaerobiales bacterium]